MQAHAFEASPARRARHHNSKHASELAQGGPASAAENAQVGEGETALKLLLLDEAKDHAERFAHHLKRKHYIVEISNSIRDAAYRLRHASSSFDIILVDISDHKPWEMILGDLQEIAAQTRHPFGPCFICFSRTPKPAFLRLWLEMKGVRFAHER
jgi:hypothetical protein